MKRPTLPVALVPTSFAILFIAAPAIAATPSKFEQSKTITVSGVVVSATGQPAADATITIPGGENPPTTQTDADGRFSFEVRASLVRGAPLLATGRDGSLGQLTLPYEQNLTGGGASLVSQRIELKPPRVLDVTVTNAAGEPAEGVVVVASADYRSVAGTATDGTGHAVLNVSPDARLQFVLTSKGGVGVDYLLFRDPRTPVSDPYQLPPDHAEPLQLQLQPTRTVEIQAVDHEGRPIPGAEVTPWYIELAKKGGHANLGSLWTTKTDDRGVARFEHIPVNSEGAITFWVRKEGLIATERTNLEKGAATDQVVATLLPLIPVKGRVLHADGSPAADMTVIAAGDGHGMDGYREQTHTDKDGAFQFNVYPDHYCLFAAGDDTYAAPAVARTVRLDRPVEDIELKLAPATRIFGRLTIGDTDKPAAKQYVQLYQKEAPDYYKLPETERLPNPKGSQFAISPRIVKSTQTDEDGRFEFHAGPGEFYLIGQNLTERAPEFTITDKREREFNLAIKASLDGKIAGRVVLASAPEQGVAEARVFGYPEDLDGRHIRATADAEGRFEDRAVGSPSLVGAFSDDKSLGAITRIKADQTEFTLALAPTATVHGQLIDEETNGPAADREVGAYVRVGPKDGPFMHAFEQSTKTDGQGAFQLTGLIPGHAYEVHVITEHDADGRPRGWRNVGRAEPTAPGKLALGELRIPKPYRPPTVEDDIERAYAHKDPAARLERLLADAKLAYNQVLVLAAHREGKAARRYFEICWHNSMQPNELIPPNLHEYMVLAVDPLTAADFFDAHKLPAPATDDEATLTILNPDGSIIAQAASADLSKDGQLDAELIAQFLANRRAPLPSARRLLDEALAEAARVDKRVLVQVGGPGCGWCVVLARYLDEQKLLVSKDYVHLKLDSRMPEAKEVIGELRPKPESGVPWMIILAADGQPLITSDAEDGNIGYPGEPESQVHWEKMLRETRQRLTDEDLAALLKPLSDGD